MKALPFFAIVYPFTPSSSMHISRAVLTVMNLLGSLLNQHWDAIKFNAIISSHSHIGQVS